MNIRKILGFVLVLVFLTSIIFPFINVHDIFIEEIMGSKKGNKERNEITQRLKDGHLSLTENSSNIFETDQDESSKRVRTRDQGSHRNKGVYVDNTTTTYNVTESFTGFNNSITVNTTNSFGDTATHQHVSAINNISNYDKKRGEFEISSIIAEPEWFMAEGDKSNANTTKHDQGNEFLAQEIKINAPRVNLTHVTINLGWKDPSSGGSTPDGYLYLVNSSGGIPDLSDNNISSQIYLNDYITISDGDEELFGVDHTFLISPAITLTKGSYYLVLKDTTTNANPRGFWRWFYALDSANVDYGKCFGDKGSGWEESLDKDFYLYFRTIAVDSNNDTLIFSNPENVSLKYNGTSINSNSFSMLLNEYHNFTTNSSVLITSAWECNFTAQNVILAQSNFITQNSTTAQWNVTGQNYAIIASDFAVKNHLLNVTGLPSHWNTTGVYFNSSIVNCTNYNYVKQSNFLLFNATNNVTQSTWYFAFKSINFIDSLSIAGKNYPYRALATDNLEILTSFKLGVSNGNKSFVVFDPEGTMNHTNTSILPAIAINWNISDNLTMNIAVNGTYTLEVWWNNGTHAGFYSFEISIVIPTSLITMPVDYGEISKGTILTLVIQYNNTLNNTGLKGAIIKYNTSWGVTGLLIEQSQRGNYSVVNIDTTIAALSFGHWVSVNTTLEGYEYQEVIIPVRIVVNTTIEVMIDNDIIFYTDDAKITVKYNFTTNGTVIAGATVRINDSSASWNGVNEIYEWTYDSDVQGFSGNVILEINATKDGHKERISNIALTVNPNPTVIKTSGYRETEDQTNVNNKSEINLYYNDSFVIELQYNDTEHNSTIDTIPSIQTGLKYSYQQDGAFNWTISLDINTTGYHVVNISFSLLGYRNSLFMINFSVSEAETTTNLSGSGPFQVFYGNDHSFWIIYNDITHLRNVIDAQVTIVGNCYLTGGNTIGNYTFYFNQSLLTIDDQILNITFSKYGYENQTQQITFNIQLQLTELQSGGEPPSQILEGRFIIVTYSWSTSSGEPIASALVSFTINNTESEQMNAIESSPGTYRINISTNDLTRGWKAFNLTFEKYGYVSQAIREDIFIKGHEIGIIFTVPSSISQGEPFIVSVFLFYNDTEESDNGELLQNNHDLVYLNKIWRVSSITSAFFGFDYTDKYSVNLNSYNTLYQDESPVVGESISFKIVLGYDDDVETFQSTFITDNDGIASYEISRAETRSATSVNSIHVSYEGSEYNNPLSIDYLIPGGSIEITQVFFLEDIMDLLLYFLLVIVLILVFIITISYFVLRRRKATRKRETTIKSVRDESKQRIDEITSINRIFCRHIHGVTFYNKKLHGADTDTDAIAGVSTAISSFIDDMVEQSTVNKGIERMERGKFAMLSYHSEKATITVISTGKLSHFFEWMLENAMKEIENVFKDDLKDFYSSDQISSNEIDGIVRKHLPIGLVDLLTFDRELFMKKAKKLPKIQRSVIRKFDKIDSILPVSFKVFFLSSLVNNLKKRYAPNLIYQSIEIAFQEDILKNLSKDQLKEVGRQVKGSINELKIKKVLPRAPKRIKSDKKLPAPPSSEKKT
ncbi:MAG: hypothetical protein ACXADA_01450 [Candidatus Hodarchaeales archaeon]